MPVVKDEYIRSGGKKLRNRKNCKYQLEGDKLVEYRGEGEDKGKKGSGDNI